MICYWTRVLKTRDASFPLSFATCQLTKVPSFLGHRLLRDFMVDTLLTYRDQNIYCLPYHLASFYIYIYIYIEDFFFSFFLRRNNIEESSHHIIKMQNSISQVNQLASLWYLLNSIILLREVEVRNNENYIDNFFIFYFIL